MIMARRQFFGDTPKIMQLNDQLDDIVREMNYRMDEFGKMTGLKIAFQGDVMTDLNTPTVDGMRIVYTHRSGRIPIALLYWYDELTERYTPVPFLATVGDSISDPNRRNILTSWGAAVDETNLYARIQGQMQTPSARFYYVVFENPVGIAAA